MEKKAENSLGADTAAALTIIGHGEDGDLGDGAVSALHPAGALVDGGQIGVHVAGEASAAGHFLTGGGDLRGERERKRERERESGGERESDTMRAGPSMKLEKGTRWSQRAFTFLFQRV